MKEFLEEHALPFFAVCLAIAGITGVVFDAPAPRVTFVVPPAEAASVVLSPRPRLDDTLAHALRILDASRAASVSRPTPVEPARAPAKVPERPAVTEAPLTAPPEPAALETPSPESDPSPALKTLDAVSALSRAIQAARNARTEQDLVYAEQQMRLAREQMQSGCGDSTGPMCQSAREIESLGF